MKVALDAERYWLIVERCLEALYGMSHERAHDAVAAQASNDSARDMVYHAPPLHVASNLAGEDKPMSDETWNAYISILKDFDLDPSGFGTARSERKSVSTSKTSAARQILAAR